MPVDHFEQLTDGAMGFERMAQGLIEAQAITVATTELGHADQPPVLQIAHDLLHRAFRDTDDLGHVAQTGVRIAGKNDQHVTVIAEQGPLAHERGRHPVRKGSGIIFRV